MSPASKGFVRTAAAAFLLPVILALYACGASHNPGRAGGGPIADASNPAAHGTFMGVDCSNCMFPDVNAPRCSSSSPINVVYPLDGTLLPPNMDTLSVQWTPFRGGYRLYEVDFS